MSYSEFLKIRNGSHRPLPPGGGEILEHRRILMKQKRTLLDILVDAGEAYCSMVGSDLASYPFSYEEHKNEFADDTPSDSRSAS